MSCLLSRIVRPAGIAALVGAGLALAAPHPVAAQAGSTTDIVVGRVTAADGSPLDQVEVRVTSIETGLVRSTLSRATGQYTIVFPDGGGRYRIAVRRVGYSPLVINAERRPGTDRLVADITLRPAVVVLDPINVTVEGTGSISGTGRTLSTEDLNRLPVEPGDLNAVAALAPGVVGAAATDSSPTAFSVAGQHASQNAITMDGVSQGSGIVPRDAIRSTSVTTSTYDIAKGGFSGGQISSTTRGGTNHLAGSLTFTLRDPTLTATGPLSPAFSDGQRIQQLSAGLGGPLVKDRLFAFGSVQWNHRVGPIPSLLSADPTTLNRLGVSADSLSRFMAAVTATGLTAAPASFPAARDNDDGSALARIDYNLSDAHKLVFRGDWHTSRQRGARTDGTSLAGTGGHGDGNGGGGMLTLTSHSGSFINDARAYASTDRQRAVAYWLVPRGRVSVTSTLADGSFGITSLSFGGANSLPRNTRTSLFEASDELSWLSPSAAHRLKLGFLFDRREATSDQTRNQYGTMLYSSLADLETNTPSSYSRVLTASTSATGNATGAVYLGDVWRPRAGLEIAVGVRGEGSRYGHQPAYNPLVDSLFARRTDQFPSELHVSPRVGVTYSPGGDRKPPLTLRAGIGEFRGNVLPSVFANAVNATGLPSGLIQLTCVGSSVPTPDWAAYARDPSTIPSTCNGPSTVASAALPSVTVFAPNYAAPRTWRASVGATQHFGKVYTLVVDALYAHGVAQLGVADLNLDTVPRFGLSDELGRPVYVPASTIDPATGATSLNASRRFGALGPVSEARSSLRSDTRQFLVTLSRSGSGLGVDLSYTYTWSHTQSLGFPGGESEGSTGGNPNRPELGENEEARPHQVQLTATIPATRLAELQIIGRTQSGSPFTPMAWGDINGDGQLNDRAFIFDPARTTDPAVASGMQQLLASATGPTRACLQAQLGTIARPNSCMTSWQTSVEVQLNVTPGGRFRHLTLSLTGQNGMAGLDALLHGMDQLHGWGQSSRDDDRLLFVEGFDPATGTYRYRVNQHFGASSLSQSAFRSPFRLQLKARYALGS